MTRVSHIRIYPTDWRSGCMGLSLEQEGLYIRMCMFMAETGRRVPLDDTEAARMMNVQTRNYRRVLGELLRIGKITRHDNGYGNDRLEYERAEAEKATGGKPAATSSGSADRQADQGPERQDREATADITPIYSGYNGLITEVAAEIHQQNQCPSIEPLKEPINTPLPPKGGSEPKPKSDKLVATEAYLAFNDVALRLALPQASKLTDKRQKSITARIREFGIDGWHKALANLGKSKFLTGKTHHGFRADLDFICQPTSFAKLHDGGYTDAQQQPGWAPRGPMSPADRVIRDETGKAVGYMNH